MSKFAVPAEISPETVKDPVVASPPEVVIEIRALSVTSAVDTREPVVSVIPPVPELICPRLEKESVPPRIFVPPVYEFELFVRICTPLPDFVYEPTPVISESIVTVKPESLKELV
jgi:hypothetical protein